MPLRWNNLKKTELVKQQIENHWGSPDPIIFPTRSSARRLFINCVFFQTRLFIIQLVATIYFANKVVTKEKYVNPKTRIGQCKLINFQNQSVK